MIQQNHFLHFCFSASTHKGYIVVQKSPPIVKGPYWDLQSAKNELRKIAKNGKSRMMLKIIDGAIQVRYDQVHNINGRDQTPANGFEKQWGDWNDILAMIEIAKKTLGKNTYCPSLCKVDYAFTGFKFHAYIFTD